MGLLEQRWGDLGPAWLILRAMGNSEELLTLAI